MGQKTEDGRDCCANECDDVQEECICDPFDDNFRNLGKFDVILKESIWI